MNLERALSLARAGHAAAALDAAVAVWRESRSPELGLALRSIGAKLVVTDPSWDRRALERMPAGQAKLQAALTRVGTLRADDDETSLLAFMASSAPDPRLGALALRFLFDNGARWITRQEAARYFGPSSDPALAAELKERGRVNGNLAEAMSTLVDTSSPVELGPLTELVSLFEQNASQFSAELREAASWGVAAADARDRLLAERAAARKKAKQALRWEPPPLSAKPRLAGAHLGPFSATPTAAAKAEAGDTVQLLFQWRKTKSPELAARLEASDQRFRKQLAQTAKAAGVSSVWRQHAAAKDVEATGWLASTLFSDLDLADAPYFAFEVDPQADDYMAVNPEYVRVRFRDLLERFDALDALLPDPRAAAALAGHLVRPSIEGIKEVELYDRLVRSVVAASDPRQAAVLWAALQKEPWKRRYDREFFAEALPAAIASLGGAAPAGVPAAAAPIDSPAVDALVTAVLESPSDDQPRRVLAGWLLEHGSPRGEFIALQLRSQRSKAEQTRMSSLERKHQEDWLGPLARVLTGGEWSRGFLRAAALHQNARAPAKVWEAAYSHPALESVERLDQGKGNARHYAGFLSGGRLCSLDPACVPDEAKRVLERAARKKKT